MSQPEPLLEIQNLCITFKGRTGSVPAVRGVSFAIYPGETFGLVGESGSGKTSIGLAILRAIRADSGSILFKGRRISGTIPAALDREMIPRIQMIFQDPTGSLNERAKVEAIIAEGLLNLEPKPDPAIRRERVRRILAEVGLRADVASRFPHEFSGGERQRIGIARALVLEPELVVADEPVSSLDVSVQAQVLNLLTALQRSRGLTYLFIAHDLTVVRFMADRIAVIREGTLVELAETEALFRCPLHPYTRALLSAIPVPDPVAARGREVLEYDPGCHDYAEDPPTWQEAAPGHFVLANQEEMKQFVMPLLASAIDTIIRKEAPHERQG